MQSRTPLIQWDWIRPRLYHLLAPLAALVVVGLVQHSRPAQQLEYLTVNLRFQARTPFDPPADPRLVFVGIDQQSLDKLGRYPWPRSIIAEFLTDMALTNANPHTVAFDIMYSEKSANPADDEALGHAVSLLPSVITGALAIDPSGDKFVIEQATQKTAADLKNPGPTTPFTHIHGNAERIRGSKIAVLPVAPVRSQSLFGFVNDEAQEDGVRHTLPLLIRVDNQIYPSLALQTLCQMLHIDPDNVEVNVGENVVLRNSSGKTWTIPMNGRGEYFINYRRNDSFQTLSFGPLASVLATSARDHVPLRPECDISRKTLLIGEAATALIDMGPTPINPLSPLPYTHLNVINNVLQNDYLRFVPWTWVAAGWLVITWITLLRLKDALLVEAVFVPLTLMVVYVAIAFFIFWKWNLEIALAWPIIAYGTVNFGGVVLRWREEQQQREELKHLFSRMLSPEVMNHLLAHPENLKLGGTERSTTILFSDIRDYTKFSEGLSAGDVMHQLNVYFERMVGCVKECRGTLHKYIGDAIMSAWGDIAAASLGSEQDARNAVRSALMMRRQLRDLNKERQAEGLMPLRIGIGLNHGEVHAGLLGASSRSEFTVIGDAVNTASRLEGMTKTFHTDLAISESVRELIGDAFLVRRLGLIQLKGKTTPTVVYEVLAESVELAESKIDPQTVALYEQAFDHFLGRRFAQAAEDLATCARSYPDDYSITTYLQASREFVATPPPDDWDGRIVMETK